MKPIIFLLCLLPLVFSIQAPIKGYGNLSPASVYSYIIESSAYYINPLDQNVTMLAFGGIPFASNGTSPNNTISYFNDVYSFGNHTHHNLTLISESYYFEGNHTHGNGSSGNNTISVTYYSFGNHSSGNHTHHNLTVNFNYYYENLGSYPNNHTHGNGSSGNNTINYYYANLGSYPNNHTHGNGSSGNNTVYVNFYYNELGSYPNHTHTNGSSGNNTINVNYYNFGNNSNSNHTHHNLTVNYFYDVLFSYPNNHTHGNGSSGNNTINYYFESLGNHTHNNGSSSNSTINVSYYNFGNHSSGNHTHHNLTINYYSQIVFSYPNNHTHGNGSSGNNTINVNYYFDGVLSNGNHSHGNHSSGNNTVVSLEYFFHNGTRPNNTVVVDFYLIFGNHSNGNNTNGNNTLFINYYIFGNHSGNNDTLNIYLTGNNTNGNNTIHINYFFTGNHSSNSTHLTHHKHHGNHTHHHGNHTHHHGNHTHHHHNNSAITIQSESVFNAIYSTSPNSISLGLIDYISGHVRNLQTIKLSNSMIVEELSGFGFVPLSNTLYFLAQQSDFIDLVSYQFGSNNSLNTLQLSQVSDNFRGTLDQSTGNDYFLVSVVGKLFDINWISLSTNEIIKNIQVSGLIPNNSFQIVAYQQNLYIIQSLPAVNSIVVTVVDWAEKTTNFVMKVPTELPTSSFQVYVSNNYMALFISSPGKARVTIPLIDMSTFTIVNYLESLDLLKQNNFFIF
ncbi:hypothetical protein CYY_003393 [Polysphondylium violaceum]|uniref:Uncharacterized protein n=1 Tax=Polysphondylium violaceum TaxID=133409 RepID=A0A8J4UUC7_9MYCE|nr:hypothetical protein CYY_003393 [Polysphondylium violaceum]